VQIEGGADHGNSGGPIVDQDGNARLVLVAGIDGTELRWGIPAEYAARMLQGYPMDVDPGYAYYDGSAAKQPISIMFADPLKRLKKVWVDCWVGDPGKPRQGGTKEPKPKDGDGPRQTMEVSFAPDKTGLFMEVKAEIPIPPISPGQIYYFQPRFINGTGEVQWGQAVPFAPDGPPVRREKAELLVKHVKNATRYIDLKSEMRHTVEQMGRYQDHTDNTLRATYAETVQALTAKGGALTDLTCTNFGWSLLDDEFLAKHPELEEFFDPELIRIIKQFLNLYKAIVTKAEFAKDGHMKDHRAALPGNIPLRAISIIPKFHDQMMHSLKALCIPLPNKVVEYGHTWTQSTNLFVPASSRYEGGVFEMRFKYLGVRDRGGRKEAVIEIEGNISRENAPAPVELKTKDGKDRGRDGGGDGGRGADGPQGGDSPPASSPFQYRPKADKDEPKDRRALYGVGRGFAYVDIDGGYVSQCELFIDLEVEMMITDKDTKKPVPQMVAGVMEVGMKRRAK
jgi:hypothetical protein